MANQELVRYTVMTLPEKLTYADNFAKAGLFKDVQGAAQCLVKIQAGAELGFPPFASMNGVAIIQGKPAVGGGMFNALIEASPDHEVEVLESTNEVARAAFWSKSKRTGQWVNKGEEKFDLQDAIAAGLKGKDIWQKYPKNMLFWRMLANGARKYFPALCSGIYIAEELGGHIDAQSGELIAVEIEQETATANTSTGEIHEETARANMPDKGGRPEDALKSRRTRTLNTFKEHFDKSVLDKILPATALVYSESGAVHMGKTFLQMSEADLDTIEEFMAKPTVAQPPAEPTDDALVEAARAHVETVAA